MHLVQLPRHPLAQLPTPIQSLPALTRALGGPELRIKRGETVLFSQTGGTPALFAGAKELMAG